MSWTNKKRCTNCNFFFMAYRSHGVCEFCTYPGLRWRYKVFNGCVPTYRDIDQIDFESCKYYVFNPFSYFMNLFLLRFLRKEKIDVLKTRKR